MITYDVYVNMVYDTRYLDNWILRFENLSAEDVRQVALWHSIKPVRIDKLINHPSKKFTGMRNRKASVVKKFHKEPVEVIPLKYYTDTHAAEAMAILNKMKQDEHITKTA